MRRRAVALVLAITAVGTPGALTGAGSQVLGSTTWLSTGLPPSFEGGTAGEPALSADGTTVAYAATAPTQTGRPPSGRSEVFVHDSRRPAGDRIEQVSVGSDGRAAETGSSGQPSVSCDGRFVAFTSDAALDPDDGDGGAADVYVRDRVNGTTELVSGSALGDAAGAPFAGTARSPAISADGRYVAMVVAPVQQTRLLPSQVYVYDRVEQIARLVSRQAGGVDAGSRDSYAPSISADGGVVAFASVADLDGPVPLEATPHARIFVWRRTDDTVLPASVALGGGRPDGPCGPPGVSQGGRLVAYACLAANLVQGDTNRAGDVFVTDWAARTTTRVSVATSGAQGNGDSCQPTAAGLCDGRVAISGDGRFVAFTSLATNLLDGAPPTTTGASSTTSTRPGGTEVVPAQLASSGGRDLNAASDVFVRDLTDRRTVRVSLLTAGAEVTDGASSSPAIANGARRIAFVSDSRSLTDGRCHPSRCAPNVFVRDDPAVCSPCEADECPPPPAVPQVRINQAFVPEGRVATAIGTNFPPSSSVEVTVGEQVQTVTTNAAGAFEAPVIVPHGAATGLETVRAQGGVRSGKASFFVVRRSAQPPFPEIS